MKCFYLVLVIILNGSWIIFLEPMKNFSLIIEILICLIIVFGVIFFLSDRNEESRIFTWAIFYGSLLSLVLFLILSFVVIVAMIAAFAYFLKGLQDFFEAIENISKML